MYTGRAGGNPTGDYYLAVPFLKWISDPILAVRSLSVTGGTIAVITGSSSPAATRALSRQSSRHPRWRFRMGHRLFSYGLSYRELASICARRCDLPAGGNSISSLGMVAGDRSYAAVRHLRIQRPHSVVDLILVPLALASLIGWRALIGLALFLSIFFQTSHPVVALSAAALALTSPRLRQANVWLNTALSVVAGLAVSRGMIRFAHYHNADYLGPVTTDISSTPMRGANQSVSRTRSPF